MQWSGCHLLSVAKLCSILCYKHACCVSAITMKVRVRTRCKARTILRINVHAPLWLKLQIIQRKPFVWQTRDTGRPHFLHVFYLQLTVYYFTWIFNLFTQCSFFISPSPISHILLHCLSMVNPLVLWAVVRIHNWSIQLHSKPAIIILFPHQFACPDIKGEHSSVRMPTPDDVLWSDVNFVLQE